MISRRALTGAGVLLPFSGITSAHTGFGGLNPKSAVWIGTSITLAVRTGVTAAQAMTNLVGSTKSYVPNNNTGLASDTSVGGLARFERDVLAYGPTMISIEFGTNDPGAGIAVGAVGTAGSYTDNMSQMIVKAQRTGARVTLWVSTYTQDATLNGNIAPYRTACRSLALTYNCDLFDTYNDIVALAPATQNSYYTEAAGSGLHFSVAGNAWLASLVGSGSYANSFLSN